MVGWLNVFEDFSRRPARYLIKVAEDLLESYFILIQIDSERKVVTNDKNNFMSFCQVWRAFREKLWNGTEMFLLINEHILKINKEVFIAMVSS